MDFYTTTDTGKIRTNNEDSYKNIVNDDYSLFIVCDGMGGHKSGEVASQMASDLLSDYIQSNLDIKNTDDVFDLIVEAVSYTHKAILKKSKESDQYTNMGTTMVLSLVIKNTLYFANIGDSRIYLYRDFKLIQLSKDHSYVQELVDMGAISEEEAAFYPRNQITSALGTDMDYKVELKKLDLKDNDYILMTTDGLTDMIDDDDIEEVMQNEYKLKETCEILQYMANSTGGKDNITITLAKY